jgi:hypothetical protein
VPEPLVSTVVGDGDGSRDRPRPSAWDRRYVAGRSHESEQILPFGPWVDALRAGQVVEDRRWFATLPLAIRRELGRLLPELGSEDGESAGPPDYLQLFEGVGLLLGHVVEGQPTVLILEDLHWGDEMSVRLLAFIGRRLQAWRLLLMVTVRGENLVDAPMLQRTLAELEREPHVATLGLGPLSKSDTAGPRPGARASGKWGSGGGSPE